MSAPVEAVAWEWRIDGGNWIPCNESGAKHFAKQPGCEWRALGVIAPASAPVEAVPVNRNDPLSALAIRFLVAAGHVTQEKANEAFYLACNCAQVEAQKANIELPWVLATTPPQDKPSPHERALVDKIERLEAELQEARKDVGRYRFIRDADRSDELLPLSAIVSFAGADLDLAVDDAMALEKP